MKTNKFENHEICSKCGGLCCKNAGCSYISQDFESLKIDYLESVLATGRVSIAAFLDFKYGKNGTPMAIPTLYLRAREVNRSEIDLVSIHARCLSLEENGCFFSLEERPSCGASMVPSENHECLGIAPEEALISWIPYQQILSRIVKRHTGKSVPEKIKEDVEELIFNLYATNNPEDSKTYKIYLKNILSDFKITFPKEFNNAIKRVKQAESNILVRKKNESK